MLKMLTLENFKAFGTQTRFELAPITLIFGENSAGKSSILQSLSLLKQTLENLDGDAALQPRGKLIDLGSFHEMLFNHDASRTLRIGLHVADDSTLLSRRFSRALGKLAIPGIELSFKRNAPGGDVTVSDLSLVSDSLQSIAHFTVREASENDRSDLLLSQRPRFVGGRRVTGPIGNCDAFTRDSTAWQRIHTPWFENRRLIVSVMKARLEGRDEMLRLQQKLADLRSSVVDDKKSMREAALERSAREVHYLNSAIQFFSTDFSVDQLVERYREALMSSRVWFDRFIPTGALRRIASLEFPEYEIAESDIALENLDLPIFDLQLLASYAGRQAEEALGSLFPMGPFRKPPERWYVFTGTTPKDVGYNGSQLPDLLLRRSDLLERANQWLHDLQIGYRLEPRELGAEYQNDLFELRLVDLRRAGSLNVALPDVGFGISQLLPFIVQSLASRRQIISIEQPEVHIHPRLQADLGNLIADTIRDPYGHQFLIETHSEHLILRLQRLVREGKLSPADVSILYVSRGVNGSKSQRLRLDERGDFVDEWPGGFFPERLREL